MHRAWLPGVQASSRRGVSQQAEEKQLKARRRAAATQDVVRGIGNGGRKAQVTHVYEGHEAVLERRQDSLGRERL
eukprot:2273752-Rhodomonas_salina.2